MNKRSNTDRPIGAYLAELTRDARRSARAPRRLVVVRGGRPPRGPLKPAGT